MHFSLLPAYLFFWVTLLPVNGQLILHTKAQITRHHHRHHSYRAPSPPEWVQALQRPQEPLGVLRTDAAAIQSETKVPEAPPSKTVTKISEASTPPTQSRNSDVLNPSPRIKNSDILVSTSFTSIPRWPKNGEQVDFLTVPLGKWTRPEDNVGLPQRPLKVKILGARHRSDPEITEGTFEGAKRVVCRLYTADKEGSHGVPITFQPGDGEIDLAACGTEWSMGDKVVESFGCVLV